MAVVQFRVAHEVAPVLLTFYVVRSFWSDRGRWREGKLQQFASMEAALRAGERAGLRSGRATVERVRGNIEADYWEDPVAIARYGRESP